MPIITDANVLIDYWQSDFAILGLYASRIETVIVPTQVADEIRQISRDEYARHGLLILEEPLEILTQAAAERGPLSFPDRVCLYLAKARGMTCVTNEKPLHKACATEGVPCRWGLSLLLDLVRAAELDADSATDIAWRVHAANPMYVHKGIVRDFIEKVRKLSLPGKA